MIEFKNMKTKLLNGILPHPFFLPYPFVVSFSIISLFMSVGLAPHELINYG